MSKFKMPGTRRRSGLCVQIAVGPVASEIEWTTELQSRDDVVPAKDDNKNSDHRPLVARFLIAN